MLITLSFIKHPIYQDIYNIIEQKYGIVKDTCDIMVNGIPIVFNNEHYILINYSNIDISGLEITKIPYKIQYFINKDLHNEIILNNVFNIHNFNAILHNNDCVYDELTNIMFIKFYDNRFDYYKISNNYENENEIIDYLYNVADNQIKYVWSDNMLNKNNLIINNNKIMYENKFINLPKIPLIISKFDYVDVSELLLPITGSVVLNKDDEFLGIVSYSNFKNIATIPLVVIKNLLSFKPIYNINFDVSVIKIVFNDTSFINYALYKNNNLHKKIITKINDKQINDKGMIILNDKFIPLCTYLWLFNNDNKIFIDNIINNNKIIKKDNTQILKINNIDEYKKIIHHEILELQDIKNNTLSLSNLNFLKYKKNYIVEINEKIMQILKHIFQTTDDFNYLYDYVIKHKYSKNKIVILINHNLEIKIIKKINNKNITCIKNIENETNIKKIIKCL
jgi:hypothetical protein